jgi:hypothetical protein
MGRKRVRVYYFTNEHGHPAYGAKTIKTELPKVETPGEEEHLRRELAQVIRKDVKWVQLQSWKML